MRSVQIESLPELLSNELYGSTTYGGKNYYER